MFYLPSHSLIYLFALNRARFLPWSTEKLDHEDHWTVFPLLALLLPPKLKFGSCISR